MKIKYKELVEAVASTGSITKAAQFLSRKYNARVHKGSVARALKEGRSLNVRSKKRAGNALFILPAERAAALMSLAVRWAIEKIGSSHDIRTWELADLAKDYLLRLTIPENVLKNGERAVYAYAKTALRRFIFLRKREWSRHQRRLVSASEYIDKINIGGGE